MKHAEILIKELEGWNLSNEETIGILELTKSHFIKKAETEQENKDNEPKKTARRVS